MKWRLVAAWLAVIVVVGGIAAWVLNARATDHWLGVHTGTVNLSGPYYGFWSGFGSDLAEFGIIGALGTAVYQLVKKFNCHEPGCWRVGNHPAAGGQFYLCYRHHPDYRGQKPTSELIARMHEAHLQHEAAMRQWLQDVDRRHPGQHAGVGSSPDGDESARRDPPSLLI